MSNIASTPLQHVTVRFAALSAAAVFGLTVTGFMVRFLRRRRRRRKVWNRSSRDSRIERNRHRGSASGSTLNQTYSRPTSNADSIRTRFHSQSDKVDNDNRPFMSMGPEGDSMLSYGNSGNTNSELLNLCQRGMDYLEAAVTRWQDALSSVSQPPKQGLFALTGEKESAFVHKLEDILEKAMDLQDECESLFVSKSVPLVLPEGKDAQRTVLTPTSGKNASVCQTETADSMHSALSDLSDSDSFASALEESMFDDEYSDMHSDFELRPVPRLLYSCGMLEVLHSEVKCRKLRTGMLNCLSDRDYLAKLHGLRLALQMTFQQESNRDWFVTCGQNILVSLFVVTERDPMAFSVALSNLLHFVAVQENWPSITNELHGRGVPCMTFYDIVLDFLVLDAFDDLEEPPSSVIAIMQNRWLSDGFKETALATAVWGVLKSKRRSLEYPDGFMAHFYAICEHLSPIMLWGFLGPDQHFHDICFLFKNTMMNFARGLFSLDEIGFTSLEETSENIMKLAKVLYTSLEADLNKKHADAPTSKLSDDTQNSFQNLDSVDENFRNV